MNDGTTCMSTTKLHATLIWMQASLACADNYRKIHQFYCDNKTKYQAVYSISPGYIQYTNRAVRHGVIIELSRLYDESSFNVNKLCNECLQRKGFFRRYIKKSTTIEEFSAEAVISDYKSKIKPYKHSLENLRKQRNKIWAHNDIEYASNPNLAEDDFPITWGEIEDIIEITKALFDELQSGYYGQVIIKKYANGGDAEKLFELVNNKERCENNG